MSSQLSSFHKVLNSAKHIIALCGAGLSAESGIPVQSDPSLVMTFRGEGGYWRQFAATELADPKAFLRNPSRVWQFYHYRRELVMTKSQNRAHKALIEFSKKVNSANPQTQTFSVITQNVDGLLTSGGNDNVDGIDNLIEMHGTLFKTRCTVCGDIRPNRDSPIAPALKGNESLSFDADIPQDQLPRCNLCTGLLRPHVVWFHESLDEKVYEKIQAELDRCDLILVIGTSGMVYPAAAFASAVHRKGGIVVNFNIEKIGEDVAFEFIGPCGETLPEGWLAFY
ncbi:11525_t:CDS:2 [Ambispora gerdemannii]|uniref:11525_t:CDS:1 n=1 Tax=Ambispora gerdemannii TaxID=144530 RepID=A0A9N8ZHB1_9GLOM|nr:11525_t:CDS:2 [Ambispora gerdemannii]